MKSIKLAGITALLLAASVAAQAQQGSYSSALQFDASKTNPRGSTVDCETIVNNPFTNCGFETGDFTDWATTDLTMPFGPLAVLMMGPPPPPPPPPPPRGGGGGTIIPTQGSYAAFSGFDGNGPGIIEIAQDVSFPNGTTAVTFDYSANVSLFAGMPREFRVEIQPSGGGAAMATQSILVVNPGNVDTGPLSETVDVAAFAGQDVRVAFVLDVPENFTGPGFFQLDNIGAEITPIPDIQVMPAMADFGNVAVGSTSMAQAITVHSNGSADLMVMDISAATGPFSLSGGTCATAPFSLPAGDNCTLEYTFAPGGTMAYNQTITITSDADSGDATFDLLGQGVAPDLALSVNQLDFGMVGVDTASAAMSLMVSNNGNADLMVNSTAIGGTEFMLAGGTCPTAPFTLAAAENCTLDISFNPTTIGMANDTLTLTSNAASSPDQVALMGEGVQADIVLGDLDIDFGSAGIEAGASLFVSVTNNGSADLIISDIIQPTANFTVLEGDCGPLPITIVPAGSCNLEVVFQPTGAGEFNDSFSLVSNAANSPTVVPVRGFAFATQAVPALSGFGLAAMALLLLGLAGFQMRRQQA
ncbi:MAG: choice-of-anchor D domain-containing protein [Xanthomonadales bacterium]|nr:choice-of-anchor D domain-containing protein [Xanthomonadales bacterium]